MKTGLTISAIGHAAVLLWSVVTFGIKPLSAPPVDSLPVDIISATEFSQMTAGQKTAPKAPVPKPLVEKVAEAKPPVDNPADKVVDKPEIVTASTKPTEPQPEAKPQETKPPPPQAKPEPKVDPIAEALKKDEAKKKADQKKEQAAKKPPQPKFSPNEIQQKLALLDKREGQRRAYTGDTLSSTPSLGTATGHAPQLSQNEMDAMSARLAQCWNLPAGATEAGELNIEVNIRLKQDGSLQAEPKVLNRTSHPYFQIAAESALRAVRTCAPFTFLPLAKYEAWKDIDINFNPQFMFRS